MRGYLINVMDGPHSDFNGCATAPGFHRTFRLPSVSVYTADDIAASGAQSLPELLAKKANIDIRTMNANPTQSQIAMRGFGENSFGRVKVMMDGEELNAVEMEAPNLARIPLGSVERVEIIHGPSPVLYGDGAVAGVVNVVTDTRDYERKTRITGKAGSQGTFGGNVQTKGGSEVDGVQYSAAYDYLTSDGYRKNSAYDLHVANASVRKNFENGSTIGVKANYGNVFYEMPGSLTRDQWRNSRRSSTSSGDWARRWNYGLGLDSKFLLAEDQWLMLDASFSRTYREAKWRAYGSLSEYGPIQSELSSSTSPATPAHLLLMFSSLAPAINESSSVAKNSSWMNAA